MRPNMVGDGGKSIFLLNPKPNVIEFPPSQTLNFKIDKLAIVGSENKIDSEGSILTPTFWQKALIRYNSV